MNTQIFQSAGSGDENTPAISAAEFQALVEMVGSDDTEVLLDLLDTYLVESRGLVQAIREAMNVGEAANALRPAHSLKSSSASIGAMRLSKLCADLEAYLRGSLPGLDLLNQVQLVEHEFARVEAELSTEMAKLRG